MEQSIKEKTFLETIKIGSVFKYGTLLIGSLVAILPVLVVFIGSFKTNDEFLNSGVLSLPETWTIENYTRAFVEGDMLVGFKNTLIIFIISMIGKLILGAMFAYAIHRFDFKLKKIIMGLYMAAMLIPSITSQVATFQIINSLGLFNTMWSVIILSLGTDVISIYIFLQYLDEISVSLDESAIIDGASYFTVFWRVILPNLKAPMVTILVISGVAIYNDFYNPFLYMPSRELKVISTALFAFKGPYGTNWPVILAGVVIVIVPILILFLLLQKHIYNGVSGSVKG
ncbi:ABC transporter permease subunit [Aerococcaceae bacterium DSM 109653]|uniref:ABC transporter permease subunit n=1 Tax=Fundicoccus ignavus TaxID=2664442 RepID=A0A844C4Z2_9LACT|nr:carbohydrate ABC transporter permease [Fundicoccus ignavus]MRI82561.1 ABC transporter permease subunit [Fundicoccus ignavus]